MSVRKRTPKNSEKFMNSGERVRLMFDCCYLRHSRVVGTLLPKTSWTKWSTIRQPPIGTVQ